MGKRKFEFSDSDKIKDLSRRQIAERLGISLHRAAAELTRLGLADPANRRTNGIEGSL